MGLNFNLSEPGFIEEPRSEIATQYADFIKMHQAQLRTLLTMERQLNAAHATIARVTNDMEDLAARITNTLHYAR